jgi:phage terminase Nu1 subunit (DNA packaging protein)
MTRWVSMAQLADEVGLVSRTLQIIRTKEPSVLVYRERGSRVEYKQPDCAIALRNREAEKVRREAAPAVSLDEARTRKALAEAELAEMEVARARGETVSVADYEATLGRILDRLAARLRGMPVRLSHLGPEVEAAAEAEAERVVVELSQFDEDVLDEPADMRDAA